MEEFRDVGSIFEICGIWKSSKRKIGKIKQNLETLDEFGKLGRIQENLQNLGELGKFGEV